MFKVPRVSVCAKGPRAKNIFKKKLNKTALKPIINKEGKAEADPDIAGPSAFSLRGSQPGAQAGRVDLARAGFIVQLYLFSYGRPRAQRRERHLRVEATKGRVIF
jgi:hypothetical protein